MNITGCTQLQRQFQFVIKMSSKILIAVNEVQRDAIKALFANSGWELVIDSESPDLDNTGVVESTDEVSASNDSGIDIGDKASAINDSGIGDDLQDQNNDIALHQNECPHCLCYLCVTTYRQDWLGMGQEPCDENVLVRHRLYRKYWNMLDRRNAWNDPRYLHRKQQLMQADDVAISRREVMPKCVTSQVRSLYPNLPGVPYRGHSWA